MGKLGENVPLLIDKARFRPEYPMKACRYIYNVWSIIVGFIGRSR